MPDHVEQATAAPGEVRPARQTPSLSELTAAASLLAACGGDRDKAFTVLRTVADA